MKTWTIGLLILISGCCPTQQAASKSTCSWQQVESLTVAQYNQKPDHQYLIAIKHNQTSQIKFTKPSNIADLTPQKYETSTKTYTFKQTPKPQIIPRFREMIDKQRQEQDERIRFPMTAEWTPDVKILNDHLRFAGPNGMLNGKPVIAEDLTEEILAGFRSLAFRRQESCTKHDWHGGLASYLVKSLKNGPKPENVYQIPSASSQETKPKGDGSLRYCSQPLPKRPPREERTDEEIAALIAEGRKAMEAAR